MILRMYESTDNHEIFTMFYDTVHKVCRNDYTAMQLDAWAVSDTDISKWCERFGESYTLVAEENNTIIGFANIYENGYLDCFYVHHLYQRTGVAKALHEKILVYAKTIGINEITADVSITAKPFFTKMGYIVHHENKVLRFGQILINYTMRKPFSA